MDRHCVILSDSPLYLPLTRFLTGHYSHGNEVTKNQNVPLCWHTHGQLITIICLFNLHESQICAAEKLSNKRQKVKKVDYWKSHFWLLAIRYTLSLRKWALPRLEFFKTSQAKITCFHIHRKFSKMGRRQWKKITLINVHELYTVTSVTSPPPPPPHQEENFFSPPPKIKKKN